MIKQTSLDFLSKLKKNNSKDWFEQNRDLYEHYKTDILELTEKAKIWHIYEFYK